MSSKTKNTATMEGVTPALVPKLRFPEFRKAKAWDEKRLGDVGGLYSSLTGKAGADFDVGEARFVTYMNVFSNTFVDPKALRFVDVKEGENQNAVASGDVFFTISSETPDEVGMSSVLLEDLGNCYLNSFCALFRFAESKRPNPVFTGYLLRQPLVRAYFTKKAQGITRFNLSKDAFRNLHLWLPSPAEQQKIAECLSSVDEVIAAQARKVDALKTHKKGLMQQLFPREGETQPRLRFPEFQNAGAWEVKPLSTLAKRVTAKNRQLQQSRVLTNSAEYGVIDQGSYFDREIVTQSNLGTYYIVNFGDFVYNPRVSNLAPVGPVSRNNLGVGVMSPLYSVFRFETQATDFFAHHFKTSIWHQYLKEVSNSGARHDRMNISTEDFMSLPIPLPSPDEQHRIATCLSSLDALIAAETQKHAALQRHKRGLMQQLFPSPEELAP